MRRGEGEFRGRKQCTLSGAYNLPDAFNRDSRSLDGLRSQCRECQREQQREYRRCNLTHVRARGRVASGKWRDNNCAKALAAERCWRERRARQAKPVISDFRALRRSGLAHPMMPQIEAGGGILGRRRHRCRSS